MERRLVLLLVLLAWAAAAATGASAQAPACEPSNLATQITLFCKPEDVPTAPCCKAVVASVDLGGGGVPCLCRVAAQPQLVLGRLNASHLLALYTACGGLLRTRGAHLAVACQGPTPRAAVPVIAPPPSPSSPRRMLLPAPGACNSSVLAARIVNQCPSAEQPRPPPGCCGGVLQTVDSRDRGCLCSVAEDFSFAESDIGVDMVWGFYRRCGGRQETVPNNPQSCAHAQAPSPPPPPPPPRQPPPPPPPAGGVHGWSVGASVAVGVGSVVGAAIVTWLACWLVCWLLSLRTPAGGTSTASATAAVGVRVNVGASNEVVEDIQVASGPGAGLPLEIEVPPPAAVVPVPCSPAHLKAMVKDLLDNLWAPPRATDPADGPRVRPCCTCI